MCRQNTIKNATKTNKIILSELFNVLKVLPRTMLYLMHTKVCWRYTVVFFVSMALKNLLFCFL